MYEVRIHSAETDEVYSITDRVLQVTYSMAAENSTNEFDVSVFNIKENHIFDEIEVFKDGVKRVGGVIVNQVDSDVDGVKNTEFTCIDYSFLLLKRLVVDTYTTTDTTSGEAMKIIKNMFSKAIPELTTNNVSTDNTVIVDDGDYLEFNYKKVIDAINYVLDHLDDRWLWYVDENLDLHVYNTFERQGVDIKRQPDGSYNFKRSTLEVAYEAFEGANRVWVIGDNTGVGNTINQYYTGDGKSTYFDLSYTPFEFHVYEDGIEKTFSTKNDGSADYYLDLDNKVVVAYSPPAVGVEVKASYVPLRQIITKRENTQSIRDRGPIEVAIKNRDIATSLNARRVAEAELKRRDIKRRVVRFVTEEDIKLGDKLTIDINTEVWGLQGEFFVTSTTYTDAPGQVDFVSVECKEIME